MVRTPLVVFAPVTFRARSVVPCLLRTYCEWLSKPGSGLPQPKESNMPRFAANLSMMFSEAPFLERFAAAADAGSAGVGCLFPYEYPAKALAIGWTVRKQGKSDLAHSAMVTYIEEMAGIDVKVPAVVSA